MCFWKCGIYTCSYIRIFGRRWFGQAVIQECTSFVRNIRESYSSHRLDIVMSVDANSSLPPNFQTITGPCVCPPAPSHCRRMGQMILNWFDSLGLRALSTFEVGLESCIGAANDHSWTCGLKRGLAQIDFLAVSDQIWGEARPRDFHGKLFSPSDHRPLVARLHSSNNQVSLRQHLKSLKVWSRSVRMMPESSKSIARSWTDGACRTFRPLFWG